MTQNIVALRLIISLFMLGAYVYIVKLSMCGTALKAAGAFECKAIYLILCGV